MCVLCVACYRCPAKLAAQLDEQSAHHQQQLQALQSDMAAQQNESLQTLESTLIEMEEMQGKLDAANRQIEELRNNSNNNEIPDGMVSATELEEAAQALQEVG